MTDAGFRAFMFVVFGGLALAAILAIGFAIREGLRIERAQARLTPAERAVLRHDMPDGTICYQPRDGWSRPLSCLRPEK